MQEKEMLVFTLPLHYTWATSHIDLYIHTEKRKAEQHSTFILVFSSFYTSSALLRLLEAVFTAAAVLWVLLKLLLCVHNLKNGENKFLFLFHIQSGCISSWTKSSSTRDIPRRSFFVVRKKRKRRKKWAWRRVEKKFNRWSHVISSSKDEMHCNLMNKQKHTQKTQNNLRRVFLSFCSSHFFHATMLVCMLRLRLSSPLWCVIRPSLLIRRKWNENSSKQFTQQQWHMDSEKLSAEIFMMTTTFFSLMCAWV